MSTSKRDYNEKKHKETISMLKSVLKKLEKKELIAISSGWWVEGTQDRYTFQIHVKDSES